MTKSATHKSVRKDIQGCVNTCQTMEAVSWDPSVLILITEKMKIIGQQEK